MKRLIATVVIVFGGCQDPSSLPTKYDHYLELSETAKQDNDFVLIAIYIETQGAEVSNLITDILLESNIVAFVEGGIRHSVEVSRRDADRAKQIIRDDDRLKRFSIELVERK